MVSASRHCCYPARDRYPQAVWDPATNAAILGVTIVLVTFAVVVIASARFAKSTRVRWIEARGMAALRRGDYAQAELLLRDLLALSEQIYGQSHVRALHYAGPLAVALAKQDRLEEAETLAARASTASAPASLGFLYGEIAQGHERAGHHEQARGAWSRAIDTYEALSAPALLVAPLLVKLARAESACGNPAGAEAACRKALERAAPPCDTERAEGDPYRDATARDPLAAVREEAEQVLRGVTVLLDERSDA
jgi:hypothetical protein